MNAPGSEHARTPAAAESRRRKRIACPIIGWVPRPLEDAVPGFVGLAFMGAGLLVWLLFWFADTEPPQGLRKWGSAAFAALFFLAGVFLARLGFRASRWWADRRFRGGREPWGQGYRWSRSARPLPARTTLDPLERSIGLLMILALLVVSNLVWADMKSVKGSVAAVYVVLPTLSVVMAAVVLLGFWGVVVSLRRGHSTLRFDPGSYPARPGGVLRAEYERGPRQPEMRGAIAELGCVEIDLAARPRPVTDVVYWQRREFDVTEQEDGARRSTLEFALPADVPSTDLARPEGRRYWLLQVADRDADGTTAAEPEAFLVPVY